MAPSNLRHPGIDLESQDLIAATLERPRCLAGAASDIEGGPWAVHDQVIDQLRRIARPNTVISPRVGAEGLRTGPVRVGARTGRHHLIMPRRRARSRPGEAATELDRHRSAAMRLR
jgi:hypothetical protein